MNAVTDLLPKPFEQPSSNSTLGYHVKSYIDIADQCLEHADELTARARHMRHLARKSLRKAQALIERRLRGIECRKS